jgi:hypothetical protein
MKFSPKVREQIIGALLEKLPERKLGACSVCSVTRWELLDAFAPISLSGEPQLVNLGGQILPSIALICNNCGNTHLLNLNVLGLNHLLVPEPEAIVPEVPRVPEEPKTPPGGLLSPLELLK